jgi:predicted phage tail protein
MTEHIADLKSYRSIIGHGGKGKDQSTPTETKDSLRSRQLAKVVDLLSEGPINGLVDGGASIYLDGVRLYQNGAYNFTGVSMQERRGTPTQLVMSGFSAQQQEVAVGVQLKWAGNPVNIVIRDIDNTDVDRCRVTVSTPQLQTIDKDTGDIGGGSITFNIFISNNGGGWQQIGSGYTISGKTSSNYQRSITFALPRPGPWRVRVNRITADATSQDVMNDLYWDSYTELIDDKINYSNSAVVGLQIDSEQFRSIPKRVYDVEGLLIRVPTNYDPVAATYSGVWDGTFKTAYSNNPAWCFYDLIVNNRYGLGDFVKSAYVDKAALYTIGKWCDQRVPKKPGTNERRYECNFRIANQQEAFELLSQMASIFRGWAYWSGGMMVTGCDMPEDVSNIFTNADAIDGVFTYSSSDIRQKHTQAGVTWNDPAQLGQGRIAIVDDPDALSRYGINRADVNGYGCTRESEAIRTGKWVLYSEQYEDEQVSFQTGLKGAWVRPGSIISVMDVVISGKRRGGRVVSATAAVVNVEAPVGAITAGGAIWLSCVIGAGAAVEVKQVLSVSGQVITLAQPFSAAPLPDTVWVLTEDDDLEPTLWRVTGKRQVDGATYEINGVRHFPEKWAYVERGIDFDEPSVTDILAKPPAVVNLAVVEYLVQLSAISVGVRVTLSWTSLAPLFEVYYRKSSTNENWQHVTTDKNALDLPVTDGTWVFQVTPVSLLGIKGATASLTYQVVGLSAPPAAPQQFRIVISDGLALFRWAPATELDVIIGGHFELRYSAATNGATWGASQVVLPSIPGTATSVEALYRPGTYFLRTFDIAGFQSKDVATIIALQQDGRYTEYARICEDPDFLGDRFYTEVKMPQQWLVIGQTGGLWDDQLADMDSWPDVDLLAEGMPDPPQSEPRHGWYIFEDMIDAGGVFTVRLAADMLAFPYADDSEFIDDRLNDCDDWQDWDDVSEDFGGQVALYIRTTQQDPASAGAAWTDWQIFAPQEYTARAFQFRADLYAPAGQNIGIEQLCIIADLRMKMDSAEDVPYPTSAVNQHVTFGVKFYLVPAVVITVQNALATDKITVVNKTREGFDLNINFTSPPTNRIIDWQARGF